MENKVTTTDTLPKIRLGSSGPMVSRFALGGMTFGAEANEATAHSLLDVFTAHGGNFIDTADNYNQGVSEQIIGKWGKKRGGFDDLILATKGRFSPPAGSYGASRRSIVRSVEASLKRLQVDAIDVYIIHGWDKDTELTETLSTLADLVHAGKILYTAWSNLSGWQLQKVVSTARAYGFPIPVSLQPQYSLLERGIEQEVLPCCIEEGIGITPWSPLGGGWLTGKYGADIRPTGSTRLGEDPNRGVEAYDIRNTERTHRILSTLHDIAREHNCPPEHVALAWLASRPGVSSILLGARNIEQLESNLAAASLALTEQELGWLTIKSSVGLPPYPYGFLAQWSEMAIWERLGT